MCLCNDEVAPYHERQQSMCQGNLQAVASGSCGVGIIVIFPVK